MTITVVTPWYEHRELWSDYEKVIADGKPDEVLIVDNGSSPPLDFATMRLATNEGFCGGSNAGLKAAHTDAVLFLNNDVKLTRPGWLQTLTGALQPGVLTGARLRSDHHTSVDGQPVPYLDGWCLAGMRQDLIELGGFDETLDEPAYFSDNLICLEARAAGMTLREVRVGLSHFVGATAKQDPKPHVLEANHQRYLARARELLVTA